MTGIERRKLGKRHPKRDERNLQLAKYLKSSLPTPPASVDFTKKCDKNWPMYANDRIGNCTAATAGHMLQVWSANGREKEVEVTERTVIGFYSRVTGYDPKKPETDNGAIELDVLKAWAKGGLGGYRIGAYVEVSLSNRILVQDGVYLFGGLYTGFALPLSAQNQSVWDVPAGGARGKGESGSWGGHAAPIVAYDARGLTCVTWGALQRMTWSFFNTYCDEAYALLSAQFISATTKKSPAGFDLATLRKDLALVKGS